MPMTPWRSISLPDAEGFSLLPLDANAKQFQYQHRLTFHIILPDFFFGVRNHRAVWQIILKAPSGDIIFAQEVTLDIAVTSMGMPGALQLYVWQQRREIIDTTVIDGRAVSETHRAVDFVLGRPEMEFGFLNPAGGDGFVDLFTFINTDWSSPIYMMNVPLGTKMRAASTIGAATRNWRFRFLEGDSNRLLDTSYDSFGALLHARGFNKETTILTGRDWSNGRRDAGQTFRNATDPSIIEMPDGREILGIMQPGGYREYVSRNSEWRWERVQYPDKERGYGTVEAMLWPADVKMPILAKLEDDTRITIAVVGSRLKSRRISDQGISEIVDVGTADEGESYSISLDSDGSLVISDTKKLLYRSRNDGLRWDPVFYEVFA